MLSNTNADTDAYIEHVSNMEELKKILVTSNLSDREKFVIGLRFGLEGKYFDALKITVKNKTITYKAAEAIMGNRSTTSNIANHYTLEDIGVLFGVSRERVRQIESSGVKGLQAAHAGIMRSYSK